MRAAAVTTSCPGRATAKPERRPGTQRKESTTRSIVTHIALHEFRAGSRLSFRSLRSLERRPGRDVVTHCRGSPLLSSHDVKQPSQRFACPLNLRARRRVSLFSFLPKRGAERRDGANLSRLRSATNHAVEAWCASCDGRARLSALHRGDFGPGAALPSPALPPENAFSELLAAQVIVPGGRGPEPPGAHGYEPPPQDATPRSASRTVSRNARHPSGDNS